MLPNGKIFIAGGFTWKYQVFPPAGLALLHSDGTLDTNFLANIPGPGYVWAAALQWDGKILLSGAFLDADGGYREELVRLNVDGSQDTTFKSAVPGEFSSLAVQPDGYILAVRRWEIDGIYRLKPDGSLDSSFQGPSELSGVERLLLQPDGQVLVSGPFHSVNGIPMHGIARLNNEVTWRLDKAEPTPLGGFRFLITGRPEARLIIEASSDLSVWRPLDELTTGTTPVAFTDSAAAQFTNRFYRAREAR